MTASTPRVRFNWEEAVAQDRDLQSIDGFVKLIISKFPGQPAPRVDAGRGSRYEAAPPTVKSERPAATMVTTTPANGVANGTSSSSGGSTPQFINIRDYTSESSSEYDMREVNPMDELSDFESEHQEQPQEPQQPMEQVQEEQEQEQPMDVEMEDEAEEQEQQTACEVCKSSDRESEIILCDDCNAEYHTFCLQPPLPKVPDETWYCPECQVNYPATSVVNVKEEQARTAAASAGTGESAGTTQITAAETSNDAAVTETTSGSTADTGNAPTNGTGGNDPTSIPIAQALESDPEKSNTLLIHACNCDDVKCRDSEFHVFCPHMKRFLRSVCWASHSDKWRSYRLARITAELFAYHAMNCSTSQCNVPLCVKIREEEIV